VEELRIRGLFGRMLSRTADNLYWMARHMERAENTARLLNAQHHSSMLPNAEDSVHRQWKSILDLFELDQFAIDETIIRTQKLNWMEIFFENMLKKQIGFPSHSRFQIVPVETDKLP